MSHVAPPLPPSALFAGLADAELQAVAEQMRPRAFDAGEQICAAGEASDRLWLITGGLVHILAGHSDAAAGEVVARQRKGDVVGAQGAVTGEPRTATVVAAIAASALELDAERFLALAQRFPVILINLIRIQSERLAIANARRVEHQRGEAVALLSGPALAATAARVAALAQRVSPRPVIWLDRRLSFAGALTAADDLTDEHATVLLPGELDPKTVALLLDEVDRVVALAGSAREAERLGALARGPNASGAQVEAVLVGAEAVAASREWPADAPIRVVRTCLRADGAGLAPDGGVLIPANGAAPTPPHGTGMPPADEAWLARHLTRTKLGLALGAGGAKGYAHVGALQVLEEAGYVVDYVSGSSIGAILGAYLALGKDAAEIDATLRGAFNADNVAQLFKTSMSGASGLEAMSQLMRESTAERSFADTLIPLVVMTVDLTDRAPAPLREGPLWEALLAATALAGVFPPHERGGHRLVDGLALVPVPTGAVFEDGADLAVSINLMGAEVLAAWPEQPELEPVRERQRRGSTLDTLLEVMDLSQLETSARHAELADVVITPRFGPAHWRDFHLADLFLAAGRRAALEQLPALRALSTPVDLKTTSEGDGIARADEVRIR
ncbi:MAG TPA: cyclic nucleotide-binding and patatin-like phospholipase domain-containing protein [Solirubrobacteraceae bacterium]|jgi:NTE family protein|nr:cyclic nucleotide-binding and patatin-like phospholipase domain-containing protein [Solirubrobacteraceae bacterium]